MGYRRIEVSADFLSHLLTKVPSCTSNLPSDVQCIGAVWQYEPPRIGLMLKSEEWEGPEEGSLVPLISPTFTVETK